VTQPTRDDCRTHELACTFDELALIYQSLQAVKTLGALPPQDELLDDTIEVVDQRSTTPCDRRPEPEIGALSPRWGDVHPPAAMGRSGRVRIVLARVCAQRKGAGNGNNGSEHA
jgi:hypothetical protein